MRFIEISTGINMVVTNDELAICERIRANKDPYLASRLDEYEREIARKLIQKDILNRALIDDKLYYVYNESEMWR